jgi:pimeloyl-ACP methyl ester carboxylesterase
MVDVIKQISLNGAQLGYCIHGAGPNKPPLVFVHGGFLRSTAGPYEELLELLARRYAVHALDLRGHGASAGALAGWSFSAVADDIAAFTRALCLERPVYVGHSLGAFAGVLAEIRHPGTFSALCLLSPGPADPRRDPVDALEFLIEHGQDREMLRGGFGQMFVRPPGRMLDLMLDAITLIDKRLFRAVQEQNSQTSIEDQLQDVAAPVLLLCGGRDNVVAPARQHDIARKVPCSKEVVFSTEGHMLPNENAAAAAREILAFLDHDRGTDNGGTSDEVAVTHGDSLKPS